MKQKKQQIHPLPNEIHLKVEGAVAGALDTSSRESAIETGIVISVGEAITEIKTGDTVLFKSWAVDIIDFNGVKHYFINKHTGGIKAILK